MLQHFSDLRSSTFKVRCDSRCCGLHGGNDTVAFGPRLFDSRDRESHTPISMAAVASSLDDFKGQDASDCLVLNVGNTRVRFINIFVWIGRR